MICVQQHCQFWDTWTYINGQISIAHVVLNISIYLTVYLGLNVLCMKIFNVSLYILTKIFLICTSNNNDNTKNCFISHYCAFSQIYSEQFWCNNWKYEVPVSAWMMYTIAEVVSALMASMNLYTHVCIKQLNSC